LIVHQRLYERLAWLFAAMIPRPCLERSAGSNGGSLARRPSSRLMGSSRRHCSSRPTCGWSTLLQCRIASLYSWLNVWIITETLRSCAAADHRQRRWPDLEVEAVFRACAKGRACVPDGIPPQVLRRFAAALAPAAAPLFAEAACLGSEPLLWKGGAWCCFPEPCAKDSEYTSQRAVVLADQLGKSYRRTVSARLAHSLRLAAGGLQCGGNAVLYAGSQLCVWLR